ncbi:MAG: shikimate kinase [bacterium]|nr:shikimate kinase [bacterium]
MNIVLTGLRGSGKTKVGKTLAKKLAWKFIDLDEEIEKSEKMKIAQIVELRGWEYFRAVESKITEKISKVENTVIATGGGTLINQDNEKALKKNARIIYLYRKPEECCEYIKNDTNRPALTNNETLEEEMKQLYRERNGVYCKSAFRVIERTKNYKKDAEEIINILSLA